MHYKYDRYYVQEGQIQPKYVSKKEADFIVKGMKEDLDQISFEVFRNLKRVKEIIAKPSKELIERMDEIQDLTDTFSVYLNEKPSVFQKFTMQSLLLAREIISKARIEINIYCIDDLAKQIANKQVKIDEFLGNEQLEN